MLGDNPEKSKNPLKKAMRRRNAKTVTFTAPTFIEASEMEFSSDEELDGADYFNSDDEEAISEGIEDDMQDNEDSDIVIEPLKPKLKESDEPERVQIKQEPERVDPEERKSSEESSRSQRKNFGLRCTMTIRSTDLLTCQEQPKLLSAGPGMVLCATQIRYSKMIPLKRRRYP